MSQSVERALMLLEQLRDGPQRLGPLAEALDIHKSTVLRLLQTLEARGFVRRVDGEPRFALGLRLLELSSALLDDLDLRTVARAHIEEVAAATHETVHLGILDRAQVVYVDKVESTHPVRMYSRIGARADAHCTGVGKALLAWTPEDDWGDVELRRYTDHTITDAQALRQELDRIRRRGFATDEQEHEESIRCIAAPVFDVHRAVTCAISVSVPAARMTQAELEQHVPTLLDAAGALTRDLGGLPPADA